MGSELSESVTSLKNVTPAPIDGSEDELEESFVLTPEPQPRKYFGVPIFNRSNPDIYRTTNNFLGAIQKYSSYSFTGFLILHSINVLVTPAINVDVAEETFMMARDIYQQENVEKWLVFGSLIAHVASGLAIRVIRTVKNYFSRRNQAKNSKKNKSQFSQQLAMEQQAKYNSQTQDYEITDESVGLGGWFGAFKLGIRRSKIASLLGVTPVQLSGLLLVPVLGYHILKERIAPLMIDGDSSLIKLGYVAHAFAKSNKLVSYLGFGSLIYLTLYHVVAGWMKYLKIYSQTQRRRGFLLVNGLTLLGMFSLSRIVSMGAEHGTVGKAYDAYMNYSPL
ncbi:Mcp1 protein [Saccharomycopsis crataegensis]|uniref:Mcp1 protein n=1 Tax=Saccharomycopsis crataegensis TaxID=43959 RepID=A0AAV5QMQ1_9ASCO|nr:Mcp1 protein [Saccharomycopsis crataegensis]